MSLFGIFRTGQQNEEQTQRKRRRSRGSESSEGAPPAQRARRGSFHAPRPSFVDDAQIEEELRRGGHNRGVHASIQPGWPSRVTREEDAEEWASDEVFPAQFPYGPEEADRASLRRLYFRGPTRCWCAPERARPRRNVNAVDASYAVGDNPWS